MKDEKTKSGVPGSPDVVPAADVNVAEDVAREDSEVKKLAADLEDLRQTLVRSRQACHRACRRSLDPGSRWLRACARRTSRG